MLGSVVWQASSTIKHPIFSLKWLTIFARPLELNVESIILCFDKIFSSIVLYYELLDWTNLFKSNISFYFLSIFLLSYFHCWLCLSSIAENFNCISYNCIYNSTVVALMFIDFSHLCLKLNTISYLF